MKTRYPALLLVLSLFLFAPLASALPLVGIDDGVTYQLNDHPNGNQAPPTYGLRLDGLYGGGGGEINTFSFDTAGASMMMTYQNDTLTIFGTAYENFTGDIWNVTMTYAMSQTLTNGKLGSTGPEGSNVGTMTKNGGSVVVGLEDFMPTTFFLGYNHRGVSGVSGWGWVNHTGAPDHVASSDWLFTVGAPVPEPNAPILFAMGSVLTIAFLRRRGGILA